MIGCRVPSLRVFGSSGLILLSACAGAPSAAEGPAPSHHPQVAGSAVTEPADADILGTYSWPISTRSAEAQTRFDRGVRLMYGYVYDVARGEFEAAREADPTCAMCWWGEAWSIGPQFNMGMSSGDAPRAYAAAQRAREQAGGATPVERALIDAIATRYAPERPAHGRRGLDSAYVAAMADVHARFPRHPEVGMLYAEALMLLEPRRGVWPLEKPSVRKIHEVLEGVLAMDEGHPGACHAYIHATETTPRVTAAERCAELLGSAIPGVSHINHMPSHTFNRIGRWGDATRANVEARETDRRAREGRGYSVYAVHNLHMLLFSATVDGQSALALEAAREYGQMSGGEGFAYEALVLTRFGRFADVLRLTSEPVMPVAKGWWAFSRGLAHLRLGAADSAAAYLARIDEWAADPSQRPGFRFHPPAPLLGIVGHVLRGEIHRHHGRTKEAEEAFREAIELEDGLMYDEPEPLPFLARDYLGALLLDVGRPVEAEAVYREALVARPNNGWSLHGLERALREQGRTSEADQARARFREAWVRADVQLPASRF